MEKQSYLQAYLTVLWEKPLNRILTVLDIVGFVALVIMVVDDWVEAVAVLAFVGIWFYDNYSIFKDQRATIAELEDYIAELKATDANIDLTVTETGFGPSPPTTSPPFPRVKVNAYGFDERGLPGWGVVWAHLEGENTGWEAGKLVWEFDRAKTELPPLFALDENSDNLYFEYPSGNIDGRSRFTSYLRLDVRITERDPRVFARTLSSLDIYCVVINYYTKRIGGRSAQRSLVVVGDFQDLREKMLKHWKQFSGFSDLVRLAESQ